MLDFFKKQIDHNICIITLDSLRYDVAVNTATPNFKRIFDETNAGDWRKTYCQATYTLPSHISLFQGGIAPSNHEEEDIYNRFKKSPFRMHMPWKEFNRKNVLYNIPEAENMVKSFQTLGYRTLGIGGVGWFNNQVKTTNMWGERYFEEFHWQESFHEQDANSMENQLFYMDRRLTGFSEKLFLFINVASTHYPFCKLGDHRERQTQELALAYVDDHIMRMIDMVPKPCHFFIFGDHGECFESEDGLQGHGFYHPKIMEVPMIHFKL